MICLYSPMEQKSKNSYTIKDIAKMAEVSRGTVDRVLHNRGKVSAAAHQKVNGILEQIEYKPNLAAKSLKNQKGWIVIALIPDIDTDEYWRQAIEGIEQFEEVYSGIGLTVIIRSYDSQDPNSFVKASEQLLADPPGAVLLAPLFLHESIEFFNQLEKNNIPCITINNEIEEVAPLSYIGQDLIASGRTAAHLMDQCSGSLDNILILNLLENPNNASHISFKTKGFRDYFASSQVDIKEVTIEDATTDLLSILSHAYPSNHHSIGVFITTSKAFLAAEKLREWAPNATIIGYDLIPHNTKLLKEGVVNFLINQNPSQITYEGLLRFADKLIYGKEITQKQYLPIDIVSPENLKSYTS